jgi:hypothetical protein
MLGQTHSSADGIIIIIIITIIIPGLTSAWRA